MLVGYCNQQQNSLCPDMENPDRHEHYADPQEWLQGTIINGLQVE